jgi:hypothetical protein
MGGGGCGQRLLQRRRVRVQADPVVGNQGVEHRARIVPGAHGQGQRGVLGVRGRPPGVVGAGKPVHRIQD